MKLLAPLSQEQIISTWGNKTQPLVSVTIITYNHELYIEQAIISVMAQVTNFPFEVIIHDDASTDNTQAIIKKYVQKYPQIIIPILQTENHWLGKGINATTTIVWPSAKGKYIAWLEGDDYWTDPYKLQKQVDFLEANPDFNICFHKVKVLKDTELVDDWITNPPAEVTTINHLIEFENYIRTPSVVFRNIALNFPSVFNATSICDYFLYVLLTQNGGKIKYFDDTMAVYRYGVGIHSNNTNENNTWSWAIMLYLISTCINVEYKTIFKQKYIETRHALKDFYYREASKDLEKLDRYISWKVILKLMFYKVKRKMFKGKIFN
jgi:glycosyltransferase involved in cell wall biosynthesis